MERQSMITYFKSEEAKEYFMDCLKKEFGTASNGINSILFERYGSWFIPGFRRVGVEVKNGNDITK